MSKPNQNRASIRAAIEEAQSKGDHESAERLRAVLKGLEDVDATVAAALAAVVATLS